MLVQLCLGRRRASLLLHASIRYCLVCFKQVFWFWTRRLGRGMVWYQVVGLVIWVTFLAPRDRGYCVKNRVFFLTAQCLSLLCSMIVSTSLRWSFLRLLEITIFFTCGKVSLLPLWFSQNDCLCHVTCISAIWLELSNPECLTRKVTQRYQACQLVLGSRSATSCQPTSILKISLHYPHHLPFCGTHGRSGRIFTIQEVWLCCWIIS